MKILHQNKKAAKYFALIPAFVHPVRTQASTEEKLASILLIRMREKHGDRGEHFGA
jgi:hypothetical protein